MGAVLSNPVPIAVFFAFPVVRSTSEVAPDYNPAMREKHWRDPNPQEAMEGLGIVVYSACVVDATGAPAIKKIHMPLEEASTLNVPPNVANYAKTADPEWPSPLDMSRWDDNYYVAKPDNPFDGPVVKDKRVTYGAASAPAGFTEADRAVLAAIARKIGV